ncbi:MAG: type II toxin-antitoxin system RelE/ParE family toxin [Desulfobacterales bacterium]
MTLAFRELIYGNYRIIYRIETKKISILTIRHGQQILPIDEIMAQPFTPPASDR